MPFERIGIHGVDPGDVLVPFLEKAEREGNTFGLVIPLWREFIVQVIPKSSEPEQRG